MAERRMFAKTIIDSDLFLDMPSSTQLLYFHLSLRADDDGFIGNPKRILRMIGSSDDDLKVLIAKSFIIPFESGVVVIKHWKIHNYIRPDRYKETIYTEEKTKLLKGKNKEYILGIPDDIPGGIPSGNQLDTQVRLGKDRIGEDSISKDNIHTQGEYVSNNLAQISKLYEQNIGPIYPVNSEWLIEVSETIDPDLFKRAIEICIDRSRVTHGYLKGIIKKWTDGKIFTFEDLKAKEIEYKNKMASTNKNNSKVIELKTPNSSNEDVTEEELEELRKLQEESGVF